MVFYRLVYGLPFSLPEQYRGPGGGKKMLMAVRKSTLRFVKIKAIILTMHMFLPPSRPAFSFLLAGLRYCLSYLQSGEVPGVYKSA